MSNVHVLTKRDALKFIANLMNEEEAVGEVSTVWFTRTQATVANQKRGFVHFGPLSEMCEVSFLMNNCTTIM